MRWVHEYSPELKKRVKPHFKMSHSSTRVDETYIKIKGIWHYLYRAVDKQGQTLDWMLSVKRKSRYRQWYQSFDTASVTISGMETMRMIQKGQVKYLAKNDIISQNKLINKLFGLAA